MPPLPGATVRTPSATFHGAGALPLSLAHCDRSLPSKSTIASDGGAPGVRPRSDQRQAPAKGSGIWPGTRACWAVVALTARTIRHDGQQPRRPKMTTFGPPAADYMWNAYNPSMPACER